MPDKPTQAQLVELKRLSKEAGVPGEPEIVTMKEDAQRASRTGSLLESA
jgi:hypothetical protein